VRSRKRRQHSSGGSRSWPAVLVATAFICFLGTLPLILHALHVHLQPVAATSSNGVTLLGPPKPAPVSLPAVAQPIEPGRPPAVLPAVDATREVATVSAEDHRLRAILHLAIHVFQPTVIRVRGSLPTLVLPASAHVYTAADLVHYGALVMLRNHAAVLLDNLFVAANAQLSLGGPGLRSLYMETGSGRFASIVGWGGSLSFHGTSGQPLTIMSWNRADNTPAADQGDGRSYIREMGGKMTLTNVRVSSLGFWSGRTGGVAWTGLTGRPSTGGASHSRFTGNTYGAFLSRSNGVTFRDDLFELNELDGVRIHRNSTGTLVVSSSASRNGGNGFVVSRATQASFLNGDVAEHNGANGFYVDGRPLVNGASASGGSTSPASGATVEDSAALNNGKTGILIEGGSHTVVKADQVCAAVTAIAVRYGATDAVLTGNYVGCAPRTGISVGPSAPRAMISGNGVAGARMGILVRNSGPVELDNNNISGATVFGITIRGLSSKVAGVGNVLAGSGFRAVDARADASPPALSATNLSGWAHHVRITFWIYLRFHPLAALWFGIAILVLAAALRSYRRKLPPHPYPASTHWRRGTTDAAAAGRRPAWPPAPARSGAAAMPFYQFTANGRSGEAREQVGVANGQHAQPARQAALPVSRAARPADNRTRQAPPRAPMPAPAPGPRRAPVGNGRHPDVLRPLPKEGRPW
jgi:hypothetical protein